MYLNILQEQFLQLQIMLLNIWFYNFFQSGRNEFRGQNFIQHAERNSSFIFLLKQKNKKRRGEKLLHTFICNLKVL